MQEYRILRSSDTTIIIFRVINVIKYHASVMIFLRKEYTPSNENLAIDDMTLMSTNLPFLGPVLIVRKIRCN